MQRVMMIGVLALSGCGYHLERDSPPPPPPTSAAEPAPTTTAEPAPTTTAEPATTPVPTTTVPATTTTAVPATTAAPEPTHAPATTTTTTTSAVCQSAYHCCQAAVAAMPIGGLVGGCGELRNADASRDAYCRQAIETYRATLTQIGAAIPAACHAPH